MRRFIAAALAKLRKHNADQLKTLEDEPRTHARKQVRLSNSEANATVTLYMLRAAHSLDTGHPQEAIEHCRSALEFMAQAPDFFSPNQFQTNIIQIFQTIEIAYPSDFAQKATEELQEPVYNRLHAELAAAALSPSVEWLAPLLREH